MQPPLLLSRMTSGAHRLGRRTNRGVLSRTADERASGEGDVSSRTAAGGKTSALTTHDRGIPRPGRRTPGRPPPGRRTSGRRTAGTPRPHLDPFGGRARGTRRGRIVPDGGGGGRPRPGPPMTGKKWPKQRPAKIPLKIARFALSGDPTADTSATNHSIFIK